MTVNESRNGNLPGAAERDAGIDRLYRDAGTEMPPARLDAAILAAARREVGARPRPLSPLRSWRLPVSIAAVVVLSVSLVTLVQEEGGDTLLRVEPKAPPAAGPGDDASRRPTSALAKAPVDQGTAPAPAPAQSRPEPRADRRESVGELRGVAGGAPQGTSSPSASPAGSSAVPDPAAKPTPQPFLSAPRVTEEQTATPVRAAPSEDAAARAQAERPDGSIAAPAPEATRELAGAVPRAAPMAKPMAAPPTAKAVAPLRERQYADALSGMAALVRELDAQPPEKWLERIAELKRQGRTEDVRQLLAEFRRRYPGHPVPAELEAR